MSMKELLEIVTHDKKGKGILLSPKPSEKMRRDPNQICIHGITRQTCSACARRSGDLNKPHAKGGIRYGI